MTEIRHQVGRVCSATLDLPRPLACVAEQNHGSLHLFAVDAQELKAVNAALAVQAQADRTG